LNNNTGVSPSKRLRDLLDNRVTRLPLSPRKEFEVTSAFRSPLRSATPTRPATDCLVSIEHQTPSKLGTPRQPSLRFIAEDQVLTEGRMLRSPSQHCCVASPSSNTKIRVPSQNDVPCNIDVQSPARRCVLTTPSSNSKPRTPSQKNVPDNVVPSPSRSSRRNLASCFSSVESKQDQSNENCVMDKSFRNGIYCSSSLSLQLAKESGMYIYRSSATRLLVQCAAFCNIILVG